VVNAGGPWAAEVAKLAGVELPIQPLRRHIFVTEAVPGLDEDFPLTIEFATGLYAHRESGGVLLGMADPNEKPAFDDSVNWDFMPAVVERALSRFPILERTSIKTGWAGLYEDTPDKHPILGTVDGVDGFINAAGFSGHGVMHAPVTGELISELIVDGRTSLDISALALSRFPRDLRLSRRGRVVREQPRQSLGHRLNEARVLLTGEVLSREEPEGGPERGVLSLVPELAMARLPVDQSARGLGEPEEHSTELIPANAELLFLDLGERGALG